MNCDKLKSVEIPNTVETVGEDTFYGAVNLASVTFAAGSVVTKLDYGVSNQLRPPVRPHTLHSSVPSCRDVHDHIRFPSFSS